MRKPAFTRRTRTVPVTARSRAKSRNSETKRVGLVERHAIDRVVERRVVHRGWIALMVGRRSRVAATAWLSRPDRGLAEAHGVDGGAHSVVLHRVDLTEEHRNFGVIRNRRHSSCRRIRGACRGARRRGGDHQDSVESHGALNRRMGAGFNQVSARPKVLPYQVYRRSSRHFGGERLYAGPCVGGVPLVVGSAIGHVTVWDFEWSGGFVKPPGVPMPPPN